MAVKWLSVVVVVTRSSIHMWIIKPECVGVFQGGATSLIVNLLGAFIFSMFAFSDYVAYRPKFLIGHEWIILIFIINTFFLSVSVFLMFLSLSFYPSYLHIDLNFDSIMHTQFSRHWYARQAPYSSVEVIMVLQNFQRNYCCSCLNVLFVEWDQIQVLRYQFVNHRLYCNCIRRIFISSWVAIIR